VFPNNGITDGLAHHTIFKLNEKFDAIASMRLFFHPDDRSLIHFVTLSIGDVHLTILKSALSERVAYDGDDDGHGCRQYIDIFQTRMPLLLGYMKETPVEVHVCSVSGQIPPHVYVQVEPIGLKTPWHKPVNVRYSVLRPLGYPSGDIEGWAIRVPNGLAPQVTHLRVWGVYTHGTVEIETKGVRSRRHDFPVAFDSNNFIIIPPLKPAAMDPKRTMDLSWIYYKCGKAADWNYLNSMDMGPSSYCLNPMCMTFPDGKRVMHKDRM